MNYLINPDVSEEIDGRETDPLTGNIILETAVQDDKVIQDSESESLLMGCDHSQDVMLDCGYRLNLIVEDHVIIEIKSVNAIAPIDLFQNS